MARFIVFPKARTLSLCQAVSWASSLWLAWSLAARFVGTSSFRAMRIVSRNVSSMCPGDLGWEHRPSHEKWHKDVLIRDSFSKCAFCCQDGILFAKFGGFVSPWNKKNHCSAQVNTGPAAQSPMRSSTKVFDTASTFTDLQPPSNDD